MKGFALLPVVLGLVVLSLAVLALSRQGGSLSTAARHVEEQVQLDNLLEAARVHANWELDRRECAGYTSVNSGLGGNSYAATFGSNQGSPVNMTLSATLPGGTTQTRQLTQHSAFDGATTKQIVVTKAARIVQDSNNNFGSHNKLRVGESLGINNKSLIQIDLSSLPTEVRITQAMLRLNIESLGAVDTKIQVLRVIQPWAEDLVTWSQRDEVVTVPVNWRVTGVTTHPESYGSTTVNAIGAISIDITELVRLWYDGDVPNDGLLLEIPAAVMKPTAQFSSDDDTSNIPTLDVSYRCECESTCSVDDNVSCNSNFRANTQTLQHTPGLASINGAAAMPANFTVAGITFGADGGHVLVDGTTLRGYSTAGALRGSCAIGHSFSGLTYVSAGADRGRLVGIKAQSTPQMVVVGETCAVQRIQNITAPTLSDPVGITYLRLESGAPREHQLAMVNAAGLIEFVDSTGVVQGTVTPSYAPTTVSDIAHVYNQDRLLLLDSGASEVITTSLSGAVEERYDYSRFGVSAPAGLTIDMNSCAHILASQTSNKVVNLTRTPLALEPVAHWKLDETTGAVAKDSVGTHDASVLGTPVWLPVGGALQGALLLDSAGDALQVVDAGTLNLTEVLTLTGWIRPDSNVGEDPIVSRKPDAGTHQYWLGTVGGVPALRFNDGSERQLMASSALSTGVWHHLAASLDLATNNTVLYVDGAAVANMQMNMALTSGVVPVRLGDDGANQVEGRIDDVRIFSGALSAPDISTLFGESPNGGGGVPPPPPPPPCTSRRLADNFESVSYSGSSGPTSWPDPWLEVGESDGANKGDIRVLTAPRALQLKDNDNGGEGVRRLVDLSQFTSATLAFDYARFAMDNGDYITVDIGNGTTWTELGRINGPGNDSTSSMLPQSFSLHAHLLANRYVRFLTYAGMGSNEGAYIDNVVIDGCQL